MPAAISMLLVVYVCGVSRLFSLRRAVFGFDIW